MVNTIEYPTHKWQVSWHLSLLNCMKNWILLHETITLSIVRLLYTVNMKCASSSFSCTPWRFLLLSDSLTHNAYCTWPRATHWETHLYSLQHSLLLLFACHWLISKREKERKNSQSLGRRSGVNFAATISTTGRDKQQVKKKRRMKPTFGPSPHNWCSSLFLSLSLFVYLCTPGRRKWLVSIAS